LHDKRAVAARTPNAAADRLIRRSSGMSESLRISLATVIPDLLT